MSALDGSTAALPWLRRGSQLDYPDSPLSRAAQQPLMLGLFLDLFERVGQTNDDWTFDSALALVRKADALGFELAFSRAQWFPKGTRSTSLDAFMSLAMMVPSTERILLISSLHVLYGPWHPLHLAKFGSTLDHASKGRWGLNILTGHRTVEHEMFGGSLVEHDQRYERADELFDTLDELWSATGNVSRQGVHNAWSIKDAFVSPKPSYGRPVLVTATGSEAGMAFAARHSDLVFVTSPSGPVMTNALQSLGPHIAGIKSRAAALGRTIKVLINPVVVCRQTEAEAEAAADEITRAFVPEQAFASDAHAWKFKRDANADLGRRLGGNLEIVGSPEQVVAQFQALKAVGIDGVQIGFRDWHQDLSFFSTHVMPLLKEAGLRL